MNYHGTSLVIKNRGILLRGKPGSGKSDLALRLIHQDATLISDDQTDIAAQNKELIATCPKTLEGKLEVRGVGIVDVSFIKQHPLHIIIDLVNWQKIDRLPEKKTEQLEGVNCLFYELDPFEMSVSDKIRKIL
ncbi:MAG TPA: hypothetical protein DD412_00855 [Holosporales bacterium]|nr:hypothetical protein [Holosporales bacterium]